MCPLMKKLGLLIELEVGAAISYVVLLVYGVVFHRFSSEASTEIADAMALFLYTMFAINIILALLVLLVCRLQCKKCKDVNK